MNIIDRIVLREATSPIRKVTNVGKYKGLHKKSFSVPRNRQRYSIIAKKLRSGRFKLANIIKLMHSEATYGALMESITARAAVQDGLKRGKQVVNAALDGYGRSFKGNLRTGVFDAVKQTVKKKFAAKPLMRPEKFPSAPLFGGSNKSAIKTRPWKSKTTRDREFSSRFMNEGIAGGGRLLQKLPTFAKKARKTKAWNPMVTSPGV